MPQVTIPETNNIYRQAGSLVLTIEDESTKTANLLKTGPFYLKKETDGFSIGTSVNDSNKKITVKSEVAGKTTLIWSWIQNNHRLIAIDEDTKKVTQATKENSLMNEDFGLIDLANPVVKIGGKSEQNAGSGKNLFKEKMYDNRKNFTLGVYSTSKISNLKGSTRHSISASKLIAPGLGKQTVLYLMDGTNGQAVYGTEAFTDSILVSMYNLDSRTVKKDDISNFIKTFDSPASGMIYFAYYDNGEKGLSPEGDWFTDKLVEAQLEEGNIRTPYELPSPSPDNPIPIKNLNKSFDIVSSSVDRNILLNSNDILMNGSDNGNIGLAKKVEDHIEITPTTDGNVYDIGVKTSIDRVKGETYTFSLEVNTQQDYGMYYRPGNWFNLDMVKNTHGSWKRVSYTYLHDGTSGSAKDSFLIGFHGMKAGNTLKYRNLKIEKGNLTEVSLAPEDIPYDIGVKNIYKTNIQLSEPLRSVGDVHDRVYLDEKDSKWKVERKIKERILNGSETAWGRYSYNLPDNVHIYTIGYSDYQLGYQTSTCTHFRNYNSVWGMVSDSFVGSYSDHLSAKVKYFRASQTTLEDWKDWLAVHPMTLLYQLATPTIEILPQTEQVKLNGLANNLFGHSLYLLLDGEAIELESAYFTGAYTSLSIYSQDVLYDGASTTLLSKLKASGTRLFDADYTQPMHYAKKPFLEATMAPEDNSPILVQDEEGPMQRQYFFDHITGVYKEDNTESFVYRGEDVLMVSYDKLDPTYKTTVKCEGELLGEPIMVKGNQVFITMTQEQKEYWYGKTIDVTYRLARSYTVEYNENTAHDSYLVRLENHQDQEITIVQEGNRFSNQRLMREIELNPIVNPRHSGFMYISTEEQKSQAFRLNLSSNYIIANGLDSADFIVEVMDQDGNEVLSPYLDVFIMNDLGQITSQFGQFYPVVNKDTLKAKNAAGRSYFKYQAPLIRTTDTKKTQQVFAVAYDRKHKIGAQVPLIIRPSEPIYDITGKSLLETKLPEQTSPQAAIVFEYFARFYEKPVPVNHPILLLDKDKDGILTLNDLNQFLIEQTNASLMQEIAYALRETEAF